MTRRRVLRIGLGAAAAAAVSPQLAAASPRLLAAHTNTAGGGTLARLKAHGAKLGVTAGPPTCNVVNGKAVGIFPEVTELVLRRLGVTQFHAVESDFNGIIPGLQAGRVDLADAGLYIKQSRCQAILFSDPLVRYNDADVVAHGNPYHIKSPEDAVRLNLKVGALAGSVGVASWTAVGVSPSNIVQFPDLPSILDGIKAGRIAMGGSDLIGVGYLLGLPAYKSLTLIPLKTSPYAGGVGFNKNAADLQIAFNAELRKAQADGSLTPIYTKWHVPKAALAGIDKVTWQAACRTKG